MGKRERSYDGFLCKMGEIAAAGNNLEKRQEDRVGYVRFNGEFENILAFIQGYKWAMHNS